MGECPVDQAGQNIYPKSMTELEVLVTWTFGSSLIHSLGPCNFQHEILLSIKIILSISFVSIRAQLHSIPFDFIDLQRMLRILAIV